MVTFANIKNLTLNDEKTQFLFDVDCDTWVTGTTQGVYTSDGDSLTLDVEGGSGCVLFLSRMN